MSPFGYFGSLPPERTSFGSFSQNLVKSLSIYFTKISKIDRVYHKATSAEKYQIIETRLQWTRLNNLKPNSQHVIYVEAIGAKGMSLPSETLVAWTDPALPAFVDVSIIHPEQTISLYSICDCKLPI